MDAILYCSNTGYTKAYAQLLSEVLRLPAYSLGEAKKALRPGAEVIHMGWLMGGNIQGYQKAGKSCRVRAVVGVGIGAPESQRETVQKANHFPEGLPLFILQGGFDLNRLSGIYKLMTKFGAKGMEQELSEKPDRTPEDEITLRLLQQGGSAVAKENLAEIIDWYAAQV